MLGMQSTEMHPKTLLANLEVKAEPLGSNSMEKPIKVKSYHNMASRTLPSNRCDMRSNAEFIIIQAEEEEELQDLYSERDGMLEQLIDPNLE